MCVAAAGGRGHVAGDGGARRLAMEAAAMEATVEEAVSVKAGMMKAV